jgi:hypothetical protein
MQDKVAEIMIKSFNSKISTKLDVGSVRLSFLRKFPKASLELKNVLVHSSHSFNSEAFPGINTDTLLAAKLVSVEFKITDILRGNYNIERVGVRSGILNLYSDTAGFVNYDISAKTAKTDNEVFTIDLHRIYLTDIKSRYINRATQLIINGIIKNGKLKSRISGGNIDFTADAEMQINRFHLYNTNITKSVTAGIDLILVKSERGILFKKGTISIESYDFGLDGSISSENVLDLNLTGNNIDIGKIKQYLPDKYLNIASEYNPSGIIALKGKIKGPVTRTKNPHIEINCLLHNGHITYGKSDLSVNDLSFEGSFSNGFKNRPETTSIVIRDLKAKLGSAEYNGSAKLSGFPNPLIELYLKGRLFPAELKEFFDLRNPSTSQGFVDMELKLAGKTNNKKNFTLSEIFDFNPEATLDFSSFSLGLNRDSILVEQVNGIIMVSNTIIAKDLGFIYMGQGLTVDGEFRNLPEYLAGKPVSLIASANVSFTRLTPEMFVKNSYISDKPTLKKSAFILPDNLILDINFKIDSLKYKSFSSSKITGSLSYKPGLLTFKSLNMEALNGLISGNGFIYQNPAKSVIAKGIFNVKEIDVNKTFTTFHNFGQNFIKAENIAGNLSGSFSLLLPMDSMLNPQVKSMTAEGKYKLINGALINFDPVKQLSSFIELSELENIHFEKMENDFFIKNNFLYIPQMDVKSTAADLTVNGKHSFDNDYEYHVKVLLSQLLSSKRKKKSNISEFGVVEDDGLGRTSLLLKITGKGEKVKVGYDIKANGNAVKNSIKNERQTLKTILNQEYGWFKGDSTVRQKPVEKKSRFRISWEETDSTKTLPDPKVEKKEIGVKNLFKKR